MIAESCGTHFPHPCPATCQHRGDRYSRAQLETQARPTLAPPPAAPRGPEHWNRTIQDTISTAERIAWR